MPFSERYAAAAAAAADDDDMCVGVGSGSLSRLTLNPLALEMGI